MNRRDAFKALLGIPATATIATIAADDLKPTDVIVIEVPGEIAPAAVHRIQAQAALIWPGRKVAVLGWGMKMRVVKGG